MPVLVTFDFPPAFGGIQRYVARLADSLASLGERVVVVAPRQPGSSAYDAALTVPVRRFECSTKVTGIVNAMLATARAYRAGDRWTIASSWFPAGLAAALLPRPMRGRLAILAHGSEIAARPGTLRDRLLRWTLDRSDVIIANSAYTASRVHRVRNHAHVEIVPCGVDEYTIPRAPASVPTILFVGRLVPRKGVDRLIEALPRLRRRLGDVRLEIIGDGPDRERLRRVAAAMGVANDVFFHGAVSDEERDAAYSRAWCFAMPTRVDGDDVEGFGIVYLEAAMAGLPTIGGKGSGSEDAIVDGVTGYIVDGEQQSAIENALLRLLGDGVNATAMGEAGRRRALESFTWKHNATAITRTLMRTV
jgi:phosphatidylinositol alpha-1,6-mannosyltransferase